MNVPVWKQILKTNFKQLPDLLDFLSIDEDKRIGLSIPKNFPLNVPLRLAKKMAKNDLSDPLFLQFVSPYTSTSNTLPMLTFEDPVEDKAFQKTPRLLHKYSGRVLLLASSACPIHCRYCFRQNFNYAHTSFDQEIAYITASPSIFEIILSGGDPLSLDNDKLKELLLALNAIPHLKIIRFHTRFPISIPERVDADLCKLLASLSKTLYFILHINHEQELDAQTHQHLKSLKIAGVQLLSQTVLLRGVNDSVRTLERLCKKLIIEGIIPYYIHQLDPVHGSEGYFVSKDKGLRLLQSLREMLPGYAIPRYVEEIPFKKNKTPIENIY